MAAKVELYGGINRTIPDPHERRQGVQPEARLTVKVGSSDALRAVSLDEGQIIALIRDGAQVLDLMRRERES